MAQLAKIETAKVAASAIAGVQAMPAQNNVIQLPTEDKQYQRFGMVVMFLIFGVFILWAAFAPLGSYSIASGRVVVDAKKQVVQHREGGVIQSILVKDGDRVTKGQTLLEISPLDAQADKNTLQEQIWSHLALEARLNAELAGQDSIAFPKALVASKDQRAQQIMSDEVQQFKVRKSTAQAEVNVLGERIQQLREQIKGLDEQTVSQKALLASYEKELSELRSLYERQLISRLQVTEMERKHLSVKATLAEIASRKATLQAQISETEGQRTLYTNTRRKEMAAQLAEVRVKLADLQSRFTAVDDRLQRTVVTAPQAGTVVGLAVHTVGGVVKPGETLMEIVPQANVFQVEARVNVADIDRVHQGLEAKVRFPAFTAATMLEPVKGEVIHVSADTFTDDPRNPPYYKAQIRLDPAGIEVLRQHGMELVQGMPAEASIVAHDRTLLEYLLQPMTRMVNHAFNEE